MQKFSDHLIKIFPLLSLGLSKLSNRTYKTFYHVPNYFIMKTLSGLYNHPRVAVWSCLSKTAKFLSHEPVVPLLEAIIRKLS